VLLSVGSEPTPQAYAERGALFYNALTESVRLLANVISRGLLVDCRLKYAHLLSGMMKISLRTVHAPPAAPQLSHSRPIPLFLSYAHADRTLQPAANDGKLWLEHAGANGIAPGVPKIYPSGG
jgi:hypothetical protein